MSTKPRLDRLPDDQEAFAKRRGELITTKFLRLARSRALRITGQSGFVDDATQAGAIGLIESFDSFDRDLGKFETYSWQRVLRRVLETLEKLCEPTKYRRVRRVIERSWSVASKDGEVAPSMAGMMRELDDAESIDVLVWCQPKFGLDPEQILLQQELVQKVRNAIASLPAEDRNLIRRFYYEVPPRYVSEHTKLLLGRAVERLSLTLQGMRWDSFET